MGESPSGEMFGVKDQAPDMKQNFPTCPLLEISADEKRLKTQLKGVMNGQARRLVAFPLFLQEVHCSSDPKRLLFRKVDVRTYMAISRLGSLQVLVDEQKASSGERNRDIYVSIKLIVLQKYVTVQRVGLTLKMK